MQQTIGILHPGAMGVSVAAAAQQGGHTVCWASAGRSAQSRERATTHDLVDCGTAEELCRRCDLVISVCPPAAAENVADQALAAGFGGLYVDANAISPQRAQAIGQRMADAGVRFVDGGIIGGPAWRPGTTWLHLAGQDAADVAACFASGPLETAVMGAEIGRASALKMCYAAYTKGTTALLCAILAAAEELGVRAELAAQWEQHDAGFAAQTEARAQRVTAKAWRFTGEMDEIAATFAAAGLPDGFHRAAADIYARLAGFKDQAAPPELARVLMALVNDDTAAG